MGDNRPAKDGLGVAVVVGLAFDRSASSRGIDWAAQSILFFGALSLLSVSGFALKLPTHRYAIEAERLA